MSLLIPLVIALCCSIGTSQDSERWNAENAKRRSGVELVSSTPNPLIRFPVMHYHSGSACYGYLYFSGDWIRYQVIHPSKDKEHSFQKPRSALRLAKEHYGSGRLEFNDGSRYSFLPTRRLIVPSELVVGAILDFDKALLAARGEPSSQGEQQWGEILSGGGKENVRFWVAHLSGKMSNYLPDAGSYGHLLISKDSIRYISEFGPASDSFTRDRASVVTAKASLGSMGIELKFTGGGWHLFIALLPDPNPGRVYNLWGAHEDILEASRSFPAALVKAQLADRLAIHPLSPQELAAVAAEENEGESAEKDGSLRQALEHYLGAFRILPRQPPPELDRRLRDRIIKIVSQLSPPPALPEDAIRHAAYAQAAIEEAQKDVNASHVDDAVEELKEALRIAPWWAEGYFNLGAVLREAQRPGEAAQALRLYLLANPNAQNAQDVKMEIYKLDYEAKNK
jgi:hypothetical protein